MISLFGKIAPLAVDLDSKAQFEPVDAVAFKLHVKNVRGFHQAIGKFIVDLNLEALLPQVGGTRPEKIEPVMRLPKRQILTMANLDIWIERRCRDEAEIGQAPGGVALARRPAFDFMDLPVVQRLDQLGLLRRFDLEWTVTEAEMRKRHSFRRNVGVGSNLLLQPEAQDGCRIHVDPDRCSGRGRQQIVVNGRQSLSETTRHLGDLCAWDEWRRQHPIRQVPGHP